jgi:molybdate-binding protein/DNA-binding XRE family transcriptional regulator
VAELANTLRARRTNAGLSQAELSARVGASRQALSAIESGRQVPSTKLALELARALRCSVDELFQLPRGEVTHARVAVPESSRRVSVRRAALGRVDGELVAHPLTDTTRTTDGMRLAEPDDQGRARFQLLDHADGIESNVLIAGCAPLLGMLSDRLARRYHDARATWVPAHSERALELLAEGMVHVAGVHLTGAGGPDAHARAASRALPDQPATLVNLARWQQGLVLAPGNPLAIASTADLARPGLRVAQRAPGSGAQLLLERMLEEAGVGMQCDPATPVAEDHADVARLVRWGVADVGVAIESVALVAGLEFIPWTDERFDLLVPRGRLSDPSIDRLFDLIDRPAFRAEASALPGYDLSGAGEVSTLGRPGRA